MVEPTTMKEPRVAATLCLCVFVVQIFAACSGGPDSRPAPPASAVQYQLGAGDKVNIVVFGNADLSGGYTIDPQGNLDLPLMGTMKVGGLTVGEAREAIRTRLDREFLVNPRVTMEVANYRPFYILGEVNHPGNYPYSADLTVAQAVAVAGGYTRRARTDDVIATRHIGDNVINYTLSANDPILPGDTIEVRRRSF